jgi:hypothetical protein
MTVKAWYAAYVAIFVVGFIVGMTTAGSLLESTPKGHDIASNIIAFGMAHIFLLTTIACVGLVSVVVRRKAIGPNGLIVYFGIGLCVARLVFGSR